ncbi:acetate--CoA ligase family protein [Halodesulfurarchaeum sp. HSR-GB]|uniref:acetate--CoA ligase family protein n=1 Tax=Halodesulfurarchaeum sp. HSR-GB TaxID=3074077 RepID=UPI00286553C5|nr:acetate--CoA ligase family protein [Halodesulfurarchaeum sp. HSR-GB]MDR5657269.1 acetate--CoA ligase family protein [Halodesulfurarchaeum sp. HSR-GB]
MPDANGLFDPDRVAVVGATDREGSIGRAIMENLEEFTGTVVPVNPSRESVLGYPVAQEIADITEPIDLAVVVVPPDIAVEATRELGEHGVKNVVVITAGFGEAGSEGATREQELKSIAATYDMNLVGPNSLGVMSTPSRMNATFGPSNARPGKLSFMSQSGAFITAVVDWANDQGIGFKDVVSLGNKAVLDESDFVDIWDDDPKTEVILGYLEGIGDGRGFIDVAREVTKETPIVLVKSGRTEAGAQAASSHTGTIAGSERAYEAGLDQAGVLRAENVQELFDYAQILAGQPVPEGNGVAVISNAGGPGVMTTDAIGDSNLEMASFDQETLEGLREALPEGANIYNPVDVIGDADNDRFEAAIDLVLADRNVDAAIVVATPIAVLDYGQLATDIGALQEKHEIPVATALMGGERIDAPARTLRESGIPNYFDPARAVTSLDALLTYRDITRIEYEQPQTFDVDRERVQEILETAAQRSNRLGVEAMGILDAYGIPTPEGKIVETPEAAQEAAESIAGDVVMKIVSPDILHKSDIGGVKVGVSEDGVRDAFEDLITRAKNYQPDAQILGVQVQEMVDLETGTETILGMNRDPQFGPLLLFGLGGIFVEVLEDTTVRVAPVSEREATAMLGEIDSAPLLRGARGREPVDEPALIESIQRLSQLVTDFPAILELDINPLVASPEGVQAVDSRLTVDPDKL